MELFPETVKKNKYEPNQRRCLQAWLKVLGRHKYSLNWKEDKGYLNWARSKAAKELEPLNYNYFLVAYGDCYRKQLRLSVKHSIAYGKIQGAREKLVAKFLS